MDDPSTYYTPLRMSRPWSPAAQPAGGGAITIDNSGVSGIASFTTTLNLAFTMGSVSNGILVYRPAYLTDANDVHPSAVTWNGSESLTNLASSNVGNSATHPGCGIWYRLAPTAGSANITTTFTEMGTGEIVMGADSWSGVHQSTPFGTAATNTGSSTTPSVTVSSGTGEVIVAVVSAIAISPLSNYSTAETERWENIVEVYNGTYGAGNSQSGAASVQMDWTISPTNPWTASGASLKVA